MSQGILFLIIIAISGLYTSHLAIKLATWHSEIALKTILVTGLLILVIAFSWSNGSVSSVLWWLSSILGIIFIAGPFLLITVARTENYRLASLLTNVLYWTKSGKEAIGQLLAQIALQNADANKALELADLLPNNELILLQAYNLQERWQEIIDLPTPKNDDSAFLTVATRIKALIKLDRLEEADYEFKEMLQRFETKRGPIAYRSVELSRARLYAAQGRLEKVQEILKQPLPYVHPIQVYEIIAEAAEQAQRFDIAVDMYTEAYIMAPDNLKTKYAGKLTYYREPVPKLERFENRPLATFGLLGAIVIAYVVQRWLEQSCGLITVKSISGLVNINCPQAVAAFVLNINFQESDALWRNLSYAFLHGGFLHIGMNSWVLFDIGKIYEVRRSWGSLLAAFTTGAIMGTYITSIAQSGDILLLVGASGGVLGVGGALLADAWLDKQRQDPRLFRALLQWVVIIVLFSLTIPNVSLWGHVGGLIGGALWGFIRQGLPEEKNIDRLAGIISIVLMIYAVLMAARWFSAYQGVLF